MPARPPIVLNTTSLVHEPLAATDFLDLTPAQVAALALLFGGNTNARAGAVLTVATSMTIPVFASKIIVANGAVPITLTLPTPASSAMRGFSFSRANGSTGAVTVLPGAGSIQALNGNLAASTTLAAHSAAGAGLRIEFWSNGTNWYR